MTTPDPIKNLRDKTIARLRTIIPGVWGTVVGVIITWAVTHGWITQDLAFRWQGVVIAATTGVVVSICITLIYMLAQWVEDQRNVVSRFIAKMLLVILKKPTYVAPSPAALAVKNPSPETTPGTASKLE